MFVLGCLYVVVASRWQRERAVPQNRFELCGVRDARDELWVLLHATTHYSVASRVPPERHDDVEDVVGRARGDVTPEETHELAPLAAFV